MKSIADLKRRLRRYILSDTGLVKLTLHSPEGKVSQHPPTRVNKVKDNNFSLTQEAGCHWIDFGKAADWFYGPETATKTGPDGTMVVIELLYS